VNVLITSASRKVSLVRAFQSALADFGGGNVIAVDVTPYAPALYFADRRFLVSPSTTPLFIDEILDICKRENVALLIPTRDEELAQFAEARGRFEGEGVRVAVPQPETVQICTDKLAFLDFCRTHGFGIPRTYEQDDRGYDFPLFAKPRFGKGSRDARRVTSEEELRLVINRPGSWIIQECVAWPEYTVDLLADFKGHVLSAVPRQRQLVVAGESYVGRTVEDHDLIAEVHRLAKKLHLVGHNTIQCFWDGKEAKFIEVNPRFGGAAALSIAAGANTPAMLIRLMNGENLPLGSGHFQADLIMLRYTADLFLKADALIPKMAPHSHAAVAPRSEQRRRAIIFDLDNTLYSEKEFVFSGFRAAAQCLASRENLDAEGLFLQMLQILRANGRGRVFDTLLEQLQIDSNPWLPTLLQVYRSHHPTISLLPGTAAILRGLKDRGIKLGLVTDGFASVQRRKITALGLEVYLDAVVCTDELGQGCCKPSQIPFEVGLTLLGVSPEDSAYVADDLSKDFAGPNRLGMKSAQVCGDGLLGIPEKPIPNDPIFQPLLTAGSLSEALTLLEFL
jgi:carbamoyl-phosphate synthase large subunit